MVW
jgi:hypothetical protein